jgi:type II secretion system protein I
MLNRGPSRGRSTPGFSLVEALVSLAIAAIAIVGLMRLHLLSLGAADKAEKMAQALSIAQNKLSETSVAETLAASPESGSVEANQTTFRWTLEVSPFRLELPAAGDDRGRLSKVTVTVAWDHGLGRKDVSLSTLLYERRQP